MSVRIRARECFKRILTGIQDSTPFAPEPRMSANFLPMSEQMLTSSIQTYSTVATAVGGVALAIFTARISLTAALVSSPGAYGAALKDLLLFFVALALAPMVFKGIVLTSGQIAEAISVPVSQKQSQSLVELLMDYIKEDSPFWGFILNILPDSIGYLASGVYSVLLGTLCAVAPFIFLHQLVSHQSSAITTMLGAVVALSSWPILWNAMGLLGHNLWPTYAKTTLSGFFFWTAVTALQFVSPLFAAMMIKSFSAAGAGKAAKSMTVIRMAKSAVTKTPPKFESKKNFRRRK